MVVRDAAVQASAAAAIKTGRNEIQRTTSQPDGVSIVCHVMAGLHFSSSSTHFGKSSKYRQGAIRYKRLEPAPQAAQLQNKQPAMSHQREMIEDILLLALMRSGEA